MPYTLVYFDETLQDVKEARQWYKQQQDGLEKRFSKSVKSALTKIRKAPEINSIRFKQIRFQHLETFPYVIHYYVDEEINLIVITAIIHKARHPDVSKSRL